MSLSVRNRRSPFNPIPPQPIAYWQPKLLVACVLSMALACCELCKLPSIFAAAIAAETTVYTLEDLDSNCVEERSVRYCT